MKQRKYRPSLGFILAIVLIAAFFFGVEWPGSHPVSAQVISMSNLRQIGLALVAYAEVNNGRLPATLQQLSPDVIDSATLRRLGFRDPDSKRDYDWLYLPRPSLTPLAPEVILAASPTAVPYWSSVPKRIVLHRDGSVTLMPDSDFQRVIAQELKEGPK